MNLFERLEKEMAEEQAEVVEVKAEKDSVASQMVVWVFAVCLVILMAAGTYKILTVWF